jgi:uracil-DNA glycosylase
MTFGPPVPSHGPSPARILILAEAPGTEESAQGKPLVGPSGYELRRMLSTIGANLDECRKVNTFSRQPLGNNTALFGVGQRGGLLDHLGPLTLNPITYCADQHEPDVRRCWAEIAECDPHIIIALGNTATWALGLGQGIGALRGSVHTATVPGMARPVKVLPTYHPAAILRQWDQRVIAIADLQKALDESHSPTFQYDSSELWIAPTLADLVEFGDTFMEGSSVCAADIETKRGQITCLSFAPSVDRAIVVPFWIEGAHPNYWSTPADEAAAWKWVRHWMEKPGLEKVFQNGLYDLQYLQSYCSPRGCTADTMLLHHSLYSELQKGLGFLGSVYCNTPSWKSMRTYKKEDILKRDD